MLLKDATRVKLLTEFATRIIDQSIVHEGEPNAAFISEAHSVIKLLGAWLPRAHLNAAFEKYGGLDNILETITVVVLAHEKAVWITSIPPKDITKPSVFPFTKITGILQVMANLSDCIGKANVDAFNATCIITTSRALTAAITDASSILKDDAIAKVTTCDTALEVFASIQLGAPDFKSWTDGVAPDDTIETLDMLFQSTLKSVVNYDEMRPQVDAAWQSRLRIKGLTTAFGSSFDATPELQLKNDSLTVLCNLSRVCAEYHVMSGIHRLHNNPLNLKNGALRLTPIS